MLSCGIHRCESLVRRFNSFLIYFQVIKFIVIYSVILATASSALTLVSMSCAVNAGTLFSILLCLVEQNRRSATSLAYVHMSASIRFTINVTATPTVHHVHSSRKSGATVGTRLVEEKMQFLVLEILM